jgi:2'-5' RNA ligase
MEDHSAGMAGQWPGGPEDYYWYVLPGDGEAWEQLTGQYGELTEWPSLLAIPAEWLHITVHRLGPVATISGPAIARITRLVRGRCGGIAPFPVSVGRAEAWETGVVCPVRPGYLLRFLRQVISDVSQELTGGPPVSELSAYHPHLTVARAIAQLDQGSVRAWISDCEASEMTFQVTAMVLVARPHDRRKTTWRVIDEVPLTGNVP